MTLGWQRIALNAALQTGRGRGAPSAGEPATSQADPFVTRRGRRRGLRTFRLILVASNGSSLVRSPIWTTALLGLGEALDAATVWQLGRLVRVEQKLAGAIAATHHHPGLFHHRTVDVDGQISNA